MGKMKTLEKNITDKCKHKKFNYLDYKIKPFDDKWKEYKEIFNYLLYYVEEWKHSKPILIEKWEENYLKLLREMDIIHHTDYSEKSNGKYKEVELDEDNICFECQRLCISKSTKEDLFSAFFRHLRNSIAHGQVYLKDNEYFFFQDLNENKQITARIVIKKYSLFKIKEEIEKIK